MVPFKVDSVELEQLRFRQNDIAANAQNIA